MVLERERESDGGVINGSGMGIRVEIIRSRWSMSKRKGIWVVMSRE